MKILAQSAFLIGLIVSLSAFAVDSDPETDPRVGSVPPGSSPTLEDSSMDNPPLQAEEKGSSTMPSSDPAAKSDTATSGQQQAKSPSKQMDTVPLGFVIVEEDILLGMKQLPFTFMTEAVTEFQNKNFGEASADLKAAATVLSMDSKSQRKKADTARLSNAVTKLETLAQEVKNGTVKTAESLKSKLAEITYHQAAYHQAAAMKEWDENQYKRAGQDLRAAVHALEKGANWAGKEATSKATKSVKTVESVANKLVKGSGWTASEVGKAMDSLKADVQAFGSRVTGTSQDRAGDQEDSL